MTGLAESVALELLMRDGVEVIWQIHLAAAAAHRLGHRAGAETLLRIADAADRACGGHEDFQWAACVDLKRRKRRRGRRSTMPRGASGK
jgi:hypothetical protein